MNSPLVQQFVSVLGSLHGTAHVVPDWPAAAAAALDICREQGAKSAALGALPQPFCDAFRSIGGDAIEAVFEGPYAAESLPGRIDQADVGIGAAAYGIAATATLVEETEDDAIRLVSALPRTYIGVVAARDLVPELKDAAPRLRAYFEAHPENGAVSFISGPSRTGDIEMILTLGVHGPENAYAIVVEDGAGS